jgi:hypothetical protein
MVDVGTALAAGRAAIDLLKVIRGQAQQAENMEIEREILDMQSEVNALVAAVNELQAENEELRQRAKLREEMEYDSGERAYYRVEEGSREGPFCPKCFDTDGRAARMRRSSNSRTLLCHSCDCRVPQAGGPGISRARGADFDPFV